jgi:hypothetical protein
VQIDSIPHSGDKKAPSISVIKHPRSLVSGAATRHKVNMGGVGPVIQHGPICGIQDEANRSASKDRVSENPRRSLVGEHRFHE